MVASPTKGDSFHGSGVSTIDAMPQQFADICAALNLDDQQKAASWLNYDRVTKQCSLEGDLICWYASSIYLSCWQLGMEEECRMLSINSILEQCNLSVMEFVDKVCRWSQMCTNDRRVLDHVTKMRSNFAVSAVLFKKLLPIVHATFNKSAKRKDVKFVHFESLVKFTWMLFISFKAEYGALGEDLLASFHLLLCCLELVCADLHASGLDHFLSNDFQVLDWDRESIVLDTLCCRFQGVQLDAKHFKIHWFTPRVRTLFEDGQLLGDPETGTGLIKEIKENLDLLSKLYSVSICQTGYVDEQLILPISWDKINWDDPLERLRKRGYNDGEEEVDTQLMVRLTLQSCLERITSYRQPTPLTGKSYVISGDQFCPVTPISAAKMASCKLNDLISEQATEPNEKLKMFLKQIGCMDSVTKVVSDLGNVFVKSCENAFGDFDCAVTGMRLRHREQTQILFYKLLAQIVNLEQKRASDEWHVVIGQNIFHKVLYACSLELVLFAYNSKREFPWVIELVGVSCVDFYKVIELIIRAEPDLSRDMVKHLNTIEERVLQELAWVRTSPLWGSISKFGVPVCNQVLTNSNEESTQNMDRFNSPVKQMPTKRKLDFCEADAPATKVITVSIAQNSSLPTIRLPGRSDSVHQTIPAQPNPGTQPSYSTSLNLFFRKVYYVLSVRLVDLCDRLRLSDMARRKAWTLVEQVLTKEPTIMRGRHLDQILLCCIYVTAKVMAQSISFHDVMYQYRMQPQAQSRVYRRVLLETSTSPQTLPVQDEASRESVDSNHSESGQTKLRSGSCLPVPGMTSAPPTPEPKEDDYGDLIRFYNQVFVPKCSEFAQKLSPNSIGVPLSPIPQLRSHMLSPRKRVGDGVYVSTMQPPTQPMSPSRPMKYNFNRSPYKDLRAINSMLRHSESRQPLAGTKKPSSITLPPSKIHKPNVTVKNLKLS